MYAMILCKTDERRELWQYLVSSPVLHIMEPLTPDVTPPMSLSMSAHCIVTPVFVSLDLTPGSEHDLKPDPEQHHCSSATNLSLVTQILMMSQRINGSFKCARMEC